MFLTFDYTSSKNETAAKKQAREDLTTLFLKFLKEKFGENNVGLVDKNTTEAYDLFEEIKIFNMPKEEE